MKKRSAIVLAAGVALALVMGLTAFSLGFSGPPSAADATSRHARKQDEANPIVKVRHRTITVHKKAKPSSSQPQVVQVSGSSGSASTASASGIEPSTSTTSGGYEGDDPYEHESEDSGSYEHESEDSGSHSGSGEESGDD